MPHQKSSTDAPVARISRSRVAKTSAMDAIANMKKPSAKQSTKADTAKKSTAPNIKRANMSKKRTHADDEEENNPPAKRAKGKPGRKPKTAASKLIETKAKMTGKKPAHTKPFATKASTKSTSAVVKKIAKRKAVDEDEEDLPVSKRAKISGPQNEDSKTASPKDDAPRPQQRTAPHKIADPISKIKIGNQINSAPTDTLDIFVFGEGSAGELGLGARKINGKSPLDVKRPRKNMLLSAPDVGVVHLACGGMHALALTKDNKILSWGVNDLGALGRDTKWDGGLRDVNASESEGSDSDDSDDDSGLNPRECTPAEIDTSGVAPGTKFVQVAASDSASFALTEDGRVYSWGTFRGGDGILGFSPTVMQQNTPVLLTDVTKIVALAAGSNHVLAINNKGKVYSWGAPDQNQLGRRVVERSMKDSALRAGGLAFKRGTRIAKIACGSYHSFAIDDKGRLWSWGLNNYGQLGQPITVDDVETCQLQPKLVESLADHHITDVIGAEHHTMVLTDQGKVLTFGRIDTKCLGLQFDHFSQDNTYWDDDNQPRILVVPTELPDLPKIVSGCAGTATSYVVTEKGQAYSWGFNTLYQCGLGQTEDEVLTPQLIDNSAVKDRQIVFAGAGGQYGMLVSVQV